MINTHGLRIQFGKHKGELVTRLPIDYLEWLINEGTQFSEVAQAELDRRGYTPDSKAIKISGHALDRASLRILHIWEKEHEKNEGLHSWLVRISQDAVKLCREGDTPHFRIEYADMKLVFKRGKLYPTLVTVTK